MAVAMDAHAGASVSQLQRYGAPDPGRSPRHQCHTVIETEFHIFGTIPLTPCSEEGDKLGRL